MHSLNLEDFENVNLISKQNFPRVKVTKIVQFDKFVYNSIYNILL